MVDRSASVSKTNEESIYDSTQKAVSAWERMRSKNVGPFVKQDLASRRAAYYRWRVMDNLEKFLLEFESQFQKKGGKIIWAPEASDVMQELSILLDRKMSAPPVYIHSNITEETGVAQHLRVRYADLCHTSVASKILQTGNMPSDHPVFPLLLQNRESIGAVLSQNKKLPVRSGPEEWLEQSRYEFRENLIQADTLIGGVRFMVAENGSLVLFDDEGRQFESVMHLPRQIYIVGLDQLIGSLAELDVLLPLFSKSTHGHPMPGKVYIQSPDRHISPGRELILIIVDNGRTQLLAEPRIRPAAYCIQCGACHLVCPVFRQQGHRGYGTKVSGPIGIVSQPHSVGFKDLKDLSFQSTLCGKCNEVCPIRIDLHQLILENREMSIQKGFGGSQEKLTWMTWKRMMLKRKRLDQNTSIKSFLFKTAFRKGWGHEREFPNFSGNSFHDWWKQKFGQEE